MDDYNKMLNSIKKSIGNNAIVLLIILIILATIVIIVVMKNGKKFEVKNNSNEVDADASDFIMNTVYDMAQQQTDHELSVYMNEINQHVQQA